jgi:hypothetical protein
MSALQGVARVSGVSSGTALKTLTQLVAATDHRVKLLEVGISFHGVSNTDNPPTVDILRQTTAGTSSALTIVAVDSGISGAFETTALQTFTAEPTVGDILWTGAIHPQTGVIYQIPLGEEIIMPGSTRLGLRVLATVSVNVDAYMKFEE